MQENRAKRIVREGGMALGTYVGGIADPQIVEIIGAIKHPVRRHDVGRNSGPAADRRAAIGGTAATATVRAAPAADGGAATAAAVMAITSM